MKTKMKDSGARASEYGKILSKVFTDAQIPYIENKLKNDLSKFETFDGITVFIGLVENMSGDEITLLNKAYFNKKFYFLDISKPYQNFHEDVINWLCYCYPNSIIADFENCIE